MQLVKTIWGSPPLQKLTTDQTTLLSIHALTVAAINQDSKNVDCYLQSAYNVLWYQGLVGQDHPLPNLYKYTYEQTDFGITPRQHYTGDKVDMNMDEFILDLKKHIAIGDAVAYLQAKIGQQRINLEVALINKQFQGWRFSYLDPMKGLRQQLTDRQHSIVIIQPA